jgi:hypothetical protein
MSVEAPAPRAARPGPRFAPFVNVFVPFALLVTVLNLDAEAGLLGLVSAAGANPTLARVVYSVWVAFAFAAPAVVLFALFDLRRASPAVYRYWQLFWAFGYLGYLIHAYYAVGVWFEWDFAQIARRQSWPVAVANYALVFLWGADVGVSLIWGQRPGWVWFYRFQWFTHALLVAMVYVAAIQFHTPFRSVQGEILGWVVVGGYGLALLVRLAFGDTSRWCRADGYAHRP